MRVRMKATTTTWLGLMEQGAEYDVPAEDERRFLPYLKAGIAVRLDTPRADEAREPETAAAAEPENTAAPAPKKKAAKKKAAKKKRTS